MLGHAPEGAKVHPALELQGDLGRVLDELGERGVLQVLVEGGAAVAHDFHAAGLVDRYVLYLAPALFGGDDARGLFAGPGAPTIDDIWRGRIVSVHPTRRRPPHRPGGRLMFTGIVEELGTVLAIEVQGRGVRARIAATVVLEGAKVGDSTAVNGCCLTVVELGDGWFEADVSDETLRRTTLGARQAGDRVNLERPLSGHGPSRWPPRPGPRRRRGRDPGARRPISGCGMPGDLRRYIIEKGSITVDGVSLTVVQPTDDGFTVAVIPHTAEVTTLGAKGPVTP